jgi:hypothetical protein
MFLEAPKVPHFEFGDGLFSEKGMKYTFLLQKAFAFIGMGPIFPHLWLLFPKKMFSPGKEKRNGFSGRNEFTNDSPRLRQRTIFDFFNPD